MFRCLQLIWMKKLIKIFQNPDFMSNHFETLKNKLFTAASLNLFCNQLRKEKKKLVFTNGCFDLIHLGHIDYLSKAADLGDMLIIGLNSDRSVQQLKGPGRPIQDQMSRQMQLAAFEFVDAIVLFDEETPYLLINEIKPDILVKGGDYKADEIVGADIMKKNGGKVVVLPFVKGYSTSAIETKIIENYKKSEC
jgi:D-glycero-beta-D-manno-heptose 1-phosphate adenylyltransferase